MKEIQVEHAPSREYLTKLGVFDWPIWEKEVSRFSHTYDGDDYDYPKHTAVFEGDVVVTPKGGNPVQFGTGDFVTFPAGMSCTWQVRKAVRKHDMFG